MNNPSNVPMMPATPEPFHQVWIKALTRPNEQTYADLAASPGARAGTAYLWYFLGSLLLALMASLVQGAMMSRMMQQYAPDAGEFDPSVFGGGLIGAICGAPLGAAIGTAFFALGVVIVQWIAGMFGGKGTTNQLAYALSAILTPYLIISGVLTLLGAVPYIGFCFGIISILGGVYVLVLEVMAVKGVNQFGWGAAIGSLFIPALAIGFLCACLLVGLFTLLGPVIGDVFSGINQSLQYAP